MSEWDDILWAIQRQARALREVLADAQLVWRDANARAAEQRFLQPRAEAEATVLAAVGAQHTGLSSAVAAMARADEQHRMAAGESAQVGQQSAQASQCAHAAFSEASSANAQAEQADGLAAQARAAISQASAAGGG